MNWYREWFGDEYYLLYSHRDREEARAQVRFIHELFLPTSVLDVASGNGRHVEEFLRGGTKAFGVDLSPVGVKEGQARLRAAALPENLCIGDMRALPYPDQRFELLLSMFNSFGYFESDDEHIMLLREWRRALQADGTLFMDYMNFHYVSTHLIPVSESTRDGFHIREERSLQSGRVVKKISLSENATGIKKNYTESVRLYSPIELHTLLERGGFAVEKLFGNFHGDPFLESSPQLIVVAKKNSTFSS